MDESNDGVKGRKIVTGSSFIRDKNIKLVMFCKSNKKNINRSKR